MNDFQFYPTPRWLANKAWARFTDRNFVRTLDPSAGDGMLGDAMPRSDYDRRGSLIDCIELDAGKHPILREKGMRVVGLDFLNFEGGSVYTHVILNPPFAEGAKHVLKAWSMLWEGEIVAIINAQTLRNPCSAERQRLVALLREHGEVEYIADAFKGDDVVREADVEVALIHLVKPAECAEDWIGPVIATMAVDRTEEVDYHLPGELALPNSFVSNQVRNFRVAVKAMREAIRMEAVALHYATRIGRTMDDLANGRGEKAEPGSTVRERLEKEFDALKDRSWASVLRSTETLSKLSAKVQKQAESQFESIKTLEFNESNVYGFLLGLVQSQPEMQMDMACDVFDQITRYHSENTVFYMGWKSNDRHRTCGMRVKTTRFIIPTNKTYGGSLDWDAVRMLADFDKVFALLDGKPAPEVSLVSLFEGPQNCLSRLKHAERVSSTYFDVRYYRGIGSLHFYPRNKEVIDRLNRVVGRRRGWLPPPSETVPEAFWLQFDKAEKFDRELREEADKIVRGSCRGSYSQWDHPINQFMRSDKEAHSAGETMLARAMDVVLERHGLLQALKQEPAPQVLLLAA